MIFWIGRDVWIFEGLQDEVEPGITPRTPLGEADGSA